MSAPGLANGSTPATRYLIVNGDDFGISSGVSRGILEAHRLGILTSTSLMVERPAAEEAARLAELDAKAQPGLQRRLLRGQLVPPRQPPALDAQRLQRQVARVAQPHAGRRGKPPSARSSPQASAR